MKLPSTVALSLLIAAVAGAADPVERLLIAPERVEAIRKQVAIDGSHHQRAHQTMVARVNAEDIEAAYGKEHIPVYKLGHKTREAAFLALVATDAAEKKTYAGIAWEQAEKICKLTADRTLTQGSGLGRGMLGMSLAMAYSWCGDQWTEEQRAFVKQHLERALQTWLKFQHANLGDVKGSNWVAVCRGAEFVMRMALGAGPDDARYKKLRGDLVTHMENGFGSLGVSQEGVGYTEYPGEFLLPSIFASALRGDDTLLKTAQTRAWWTLAMYTHNFMDHSRKFVQTGVAHSSNTDSGWVSMLLNLCPSNELPHYLWFYDRHAGRLAPGDDMDKFDPARAGTVYALLYYPESVEAKDPTGVLPAAVQDDHGFYFFRNRWKDKNDIQVSIAADTHHHGHAWDQAEQMAINLMGFDTRFIGGPAKERDAAMYSTLLVDGQWHKKNAVKETGEAVALDVSKTGGYAIVGGGALLKGYGVEDARRHLRVDFLPDNGALVSTLDDITSTAEHTYTWQANLGDEQSDDGVKLSSGTEAGRPFFLMQGRGGFVKGWVLHPADATLKADGDPLRVETKNANAKIWIVMLASATAPPEASVSGEGMDSALTVAGKTVAFDSERITLK